MSDVTFAVCQAGQLIEIWGTDLFLQMLDVVDECMVRSGHRIRDRSVRVGAVLPGQSCGAPSTVRRLNHVGSSRSLMMADSNFKAVREIDVKKKSVLIPNGVWHSTGAWAAGDRIIV